MHLPQQITPTNRLRLESCFLCSCSTVPRTLVPGDPLPPTRSLFRPCDEFLRFSRRGVREKISNLAHLRLPCCDLRFSSKLWHPGHPLFGLPPSTLSSSLCLPLPFLSICLSKSSSISPDVNDTFPFSLRICSRPKDPPF